jgi:hypothetical protein
MRLKGVRVSRGSEVMSKGVFVVGRTTSCHDTTPSCRREVLRCASCRGAWRRQLPAARL